MMKTILGGLVCVVVLSGCVSLGPFVTDVTPLEDGRIRVKKCLVHGNLLPITAALYDDECKIEIVKTRAAP